MIVKLLAVACGESISAVLRSLVYELIEYKYHSDFIYMPLYMLVANYFGISLAIVVCCPNLSKSILTPTLTCIA